MSDNPQQIHTLGKKDSSIQEDDPQLKELESLTADESYAESVKTLETAILEHMKRTIFDNKLRAEDGNGYNKDDYDVDTLPSVLAINNTIKFLNQLTKNNLRKPLISLDLEGGFNFDWASDKDMLSILVENDGTFIALKSISKNTEDRESLTLEEVIDFIRDMKLIQKGHFVKSHNPIHPGEVLFEDFMKPSNISPKMLSKLTNLPLQNINDIITGKCSITSEISLRLSQVLKMSNDFWTNLQTQYDLEIEQSHLP